MAKGSKRRQRDTTEIASDPLLPLMEMVEPLPLLNPFEGVTSLSEIEDRRLFHPERASIFSTPARSLLGEVTDVTAKDARLGKQRVSRADGVAFSRPDDTVICVRRRERREVLFASRKTGRGARSRRRRNAHTDVSC